MREGGHSVLSVEMRGFETELKAAIHFCMSSAHEELHAVSGIASTTSETSSASGNGLGHDRGDHFSGLTAPTPPCLQELVLVAGWPL